MEISPKIEFEWDENKNKLNKVNHKVTFQQATQIFSDPFCLKRIDDRFDYGEERWQAIGSVQGVIVLLVAYTHRDDNDVEIIRLISARKVNKAEREEYELSTF